MLTSLTCLERRALWAWKTVSCCFFNKHLEKPCCQTQGDYCRIADTAYPPYPITTSRAYRADAAHLQDTHNLTFLTHHHWSWVICANGLWRQLLRRGDTEEECCGRSRAGWNAYWWLASKAEPFEVLQWCQRVMGELIGKLDRRQVLSENTEGCWERSTSHREHVPARGEEKLWWGWTYRWR